MKNSIHCSIFLCALALLALPLRCVADTAICHVVDSAGKPIANAVVYSILNPSDLNDISTSTTDTSGNVTLDVDNDANAAYRLYVIDAPGFAPSGGSVVSGENTFVLGLPTKLTGKVVNSKGEPVAGAIVCAQFALTAEGKTSEPFSGRWSIFLIGPLADRYTAKTDAAGMYTLEGLPAQSQVLVQMDDPRYVPNVVASTKGATEAPVLTAEAGTSISGKVIRQDGKPIDTGLKVRAEPSDRKSHTMMPPTAKIAADGTYIISGIWPGSYTVSIYSLPKAGAPPDWVSPVPVKVTATIPAPGAAADLVLTSGEIVTGTVLDSDTKKTLANVGVAFRESSVGRNTRDEAAKTDADGKFKVRLWIGKSEVHIYSVPDGYACEPNASLTTVTTTVADQTVAMDALLLKRAPVVIGTAVDDSGKPVPNVVLETEKLQHNGIFVTIPPATTGDNGDFSIRRMVPGEFWIDAGASWDVVSPKSFTVPIASPIKLVLKKNVTADIRGTVVDTANLPVAGVDVAFDVDHHTSTGDYTTNQVDVTTEADGTYTLPDAPVDSNRVHRINVAKDGYVLISGGNVSSSNGKVIVSPIVIVRLGAKVNGMVLNGLGKPVAGAWISCPDLADRAALVQTDAAGHFELDNIAVGSVNVYAAKGMFFGRSTLQASAAPAKSIVRLPAVPITPIGPANLSKAIVMLTRSINSQLLPKNHGDEGRMRDEAAHIIAEASPDAAVSFILSTSSIGTEDLGSIVSAKTDSDPVGIAAWALFPTKRMSDNIGRGHVAATVGLAVAPYDPEAAAPYYDIASRLIHFHHLDEGSIFDAMSLTALAYLLHRPEADDDYANVSAALDDLTKKSKNDPNASSNDDWLLLNLAKIIALGNVDKAIAMLRAMPVDTRYTYVSEITAELVKPNPTGALTVYHWVAQESPSNSLQWAQDEALCNVLPIIYKTDPKGAVEQAHSIVDGNTQDQALTDLADLMPLAKAASLYSEAEEKAVNELYGNGYSPACIASHAWQRDKVLGAALFKTALAKFTADAAHNQPHTGRGLSYSGFAFYYSNIDPAFSRLLLESQFIKNNETAEQFSDADNTDADVAAMCAIDINRAAELAGEIKDANTSYHARLRPAQYLLLTPQQRSTIPFEDWIRRFDWVPGMLPN
jgi:hypothetical protein